ncbi:MAG: PEP-CTERM/exosortase system-associated acyltransferase [Hahellaceae bacterium]|nr:PEP-CTERM/exosortase system-associated acyltransferase [Hahellaceae bacterium]
MTHTFSDNFQIILANTHETRLACHQLRYDVYCKEFGFESAKAFPDGLEWDTFDEWSTHYLIRTETTHESVGTVRIVNANPRLGRLTPIERLYAVKYPEQPCPFEPQTNFCEISRLTLAQKFRRQSSTPNARDSIEPISSRAAPLLYLTLVYHLLNQSDYRRAYAMLEPRLGRHIARIGFPVRRLGEVVDYHGQRAPFEVQVEGLYDALSPWLRRCYDDVASEIKSADQLVVKRPRMPLSGGIITPRPALLFPRLAIE